MSPPRRSWFHAIAKVMEPEASCPMQAALVVQVKELLAQKTRSCLCPATVLGTGFWAATLLQARGGTDYRPLLESVEILSRSFVGKVDQGLAMARLISVGAVTLAALPKQKRTATQGVPQLRNC